MTLVFPTVVCIASLIAVLRFSLLIDVLLDRIAENLDDPRNQGSVRQSPTLALPHRPVAAALGCPHPRLPRPPHHRRQNPPRSHPLPQALLASARSTDHHVPTRNATVNGLTSMGTSARSGESPAHGARTAPRMTQLRQLLRLHAAPAVTVGSCRCSASGRQPGCLG